MHFLIFFVCNLYLQVTEVFNYSQDDLLTEDMLVLDTHAEVFVWIGQSVDSKEKQKAFDIGQVFGVSFSIRTILFCFCYNNIVYQYSLFPEVHRACHITRRFIPRCTTL